MKHLFVFGLGYTGQRFAGLMAKEGYRISGTSRSNEVCQRLTDDGIDCRLFDGSEPVAASLLDDVTDILLSIPPNVEGDIVYHTMAGELMDRAGQFNWVGYLSTTGVYGDHQGGLVDETTPESPSTERGDKRVLAEAQWQSLCELGGLPVHIFRLAGIYGPGSNQLEKLIAGKAKRRIKPGQVFSRIHVDDLCAILQASIKAPNPGRVYNVCDDEAVPPQDVVTYAARLLNMEPPEEIAFNPDDMTPMGLSFFAESKRVSNERVKTELGYEFQYPTYREGLKALLPSITGNR